ncbi:hypothetical protein KIH74_31290 [Kineosporia sp. J2-2]|uniref:Poxvirus protein I5 n=1 Tax=Kineosporia corallincola TaxID=2835133 RepID=A0ABS5TRQ0_9ACTN|nr:hypothetical protein [Kineosporia corallincola]MBT0773473.1 hypothetical protein [Kineosporia corallincola]
MPRHSADRTLAGPSPSFALLGETLVTGALVAVGSLGVVTALPVIALAVRHLRAHLAGESTGWRTTLSELPLALRSLILPGILVPAALVVLSLNLWITRNAALPGGPAVTAISYGLVLAVIVVALRTAGSWSGEMPWPEQTRRAAARSLADLPGTGLLLGALVMSAAITLMFPPLLIVLGGLLALAALAVESRLQDERLTAGS